MKAIKLKDRSIADLRVRLMVLIKIIREAQKAGDERWKEPARQQRIINKVLVTKIKEARQQAGESEPKHVKIGMQPLHLFSRAPNNTEQPSKQNTEEKR